MFERFRIKTALRSEVIGLRDDTVDPMAMARAELMFYHPAFLVAPMMKQRRWTSGQAMIFLVTDVPLQSEQHGEMVAYAKDDPPAYAALRRIYRHVIVLAEADPALAACISRPQPGQPIPFSTDA